jgi:hypothetical protein
MSIESPFKSSPELFDGYDGKDRSTEQQSAFDEYHKQMMESAPDYIKQAIAERKAA